MTQSPHMCSIPSERESHKLLMVGFTAVGLPFQVFTELPNGFRHMWDFDLKSRELVFHCSAVGHGLKIYADCGARVIWIHDPSELVRPLRDGVRLISYLPNSWSDPFQRAKERRFPWY